MYKITPKAITTDLSLAWPDRYFRASPPMLFRAYTESDNAPARK